MNLLIVTRLVTISFLTAVIAVGVSSRIAQADLLQKRKSCASSIKVSEVTLPNRLDLSEDLAISIAVQGGTSGLPSSLKGREAFLFGSTVSKVGFFRMVEKITFFKDPKGNGTYKARINLPRFATATNLWPAIKKAQADWGVKEIDLQFQSRLADPRGCLSAPFSANTLLDVNGFTRNNSIPGSPSVITKLEGPSSITFGESFVVRGFVSDPDNDLKDSPKISGYLSADPFPARFPLPAGLKAKKISADSFEATISTDSFASYEKLTRFLPGETVTVSAIIMVEDRAGHLSEPAEIRFRVNQNSDVKKLEVSHANH